MIKCQPIIGVSDVEKSSQWYQDLLGCSNTHGGDAFGMLADKKGDTFLCLHKWGDHDHPTLSNQETQVGNGLIIYIIVEDLVAVWQNAQNLNATIEESRNISPNSGKEQFCVKDLDGYYLMISL